jgi:ABC-2 type transport system permease protein
VAAVLARDAKVFFRYPLALVRLPADAVVWFAPIYFLGRAFHGGAFRDYTSFALLGLVVQAYISAVLWGVAFSLKQDMDTGTLEANWLTPASPGLQLLGRVAWNLLLGTGESLLMLAVAGAIYGLRGDWAGFLAALPWLLPMLVALYGFGLGFAGLIFFIRQANAVTDATQFVLSVLSGQSLPVGDLPRGLAAVALALPTTYGLDALRGLVLGSPTLLPLAAEEHVLLAMAAPAAALGALVFWAFERHVRRSGTLALH